MAKYRVTPPTTEGRFRAVFSAANVNTAGWTDLDSSDFVSVVSGNALASGLTFVSLTAYAASGEVFYLKYRPRTSATDPTDVSDGVIPVVSSWFDNPTILYDGPVNTISFKKTNAADDVLFIAGFEL
jgi:hypothetical protein